ncbi:MAG: PQQ-like beta-propeller repeat protein [Acidobacteria bacterium]|nr:PQQ-like beta-propeller repeat protein [Acidobacteriota bacterium]
MNVARHVLLASACIATMPTFLSAQDWTQFGGPHRNFHADTKNLSTIWPAAGLRKIWQRDLGEGYSAISVDGGRLFTMYRNGSKDVAVALDAATGKTIWEFSYDAPFSAEYSMENGPGPHATPLVTAAAVFTAGATGIMHALDKNSGKLLWSHDLMTEFHGTLRRNGYACSPLAFQDTVIMMVGGKGNALVAFKQSDGSVAWKSGDFENSPSSPLLIDVDGQKQLVAFFYDTIAGFDPANGALLWSHPHKTEFGLNVTMPVWGEDHLLFMTSAYDGGSRVLKLTQAGGKTSVVESWTSRLMRVHYGSAIRVGDFVYASSGDFGPAPITAINIQTGQIAWRYRGFSRANLLFADGHLIVLDEDGNLALATPTAEGLQIESKFQALQTKSWTVPTLIGQTLFLRDRKTIQALSMELSPVTAQKTSP